MTPEDILSKHPQAQFNTTGQVAVRRYMTIPKLIDGCPSGKEYMATVEANICLAWVDIGDLDCVLTRMHGCCGGNKTREYSVADETHVRRWTNRGGR